MTPSQLIAFVNALSLGDLDALRLKLAEAREACLAMGQGELACCLDEASQALGVADLRTYRRKLETVVSKLGHLR
jgi:hypothetical protein